MSLTDGSTSRLTLVRVKVLFIIHFNVLLCCLCVYLCILYHICCCGVMNTLIAAWYVQYCSKRLVFFPTNLCNLTNHPSQLSLAILSWVGAMSTSGWGVKAGVVRVWVAGKNVWSHSYTRAISERFEYKFNKSKVMSLKW